MTQQISSRVKLVDGSTPTTAPGRQHRHAVGRDAAPGRPRAQRHLVARRHRGAELRQPPHAQARRPGADAGQHAHGHGEGRRPDDVRPRPRDPERHRADADADLDGQGRRQRPGRGRAGHDHRAARRTSARSAATTSSTSSPPSPPTAACRRSTWKLDGTTVPAPNDGRTLKLADLDAGQRHAHADRHDRRQHAHVGRRRDRRGHDLHGLDAEGDRQPGRRRGPRVHLRGPVLDEARRDRRQAGLRRARVPRRRRRLAELLRLADRRQRAVPVLGHGHGHRRAQLRQARPTAAT